MDKESIIRNDLDELEIKINADPDNIEYKKNKVLKLFELATFYIFQSEEKSKEYLLLAEEISVQIDFTFGKGKTNHLRGMREYYLMNYKVAIEYYQKALEFYYISNSNIEIASIHNNLGLVFSALNQFPEAIQYFNKSIPVFIQYQYDTGLANAYNNLGIVYKYKKNYRKALYYYNLDLKISQKNNNIQTMARAFNNLSAVYIQQKKYPEALLCIKNSIQYHKEINNFNGLTNNLMIYAQLLFIDHKKTAAFRVLNEAQNLAKKNNNKRALNTVYEMKEKFYIKDGQYKKAIYFMDLYHKNNLELFNENKAEKLAQIQALLEQRETEKKAIMATAIAASHEMRQPMMILQANLEMLLMDLDHNCKNEKYDKYKSKISEALIRMEDVLNQLIDFKNIRYDQYTDNVDMIKIRESDQTP